MTEIASELEALRKIRRELISGQAASKVTFDAGNGVKRSVEFSSANLTELNKEIVRLEREAGRSQRFAFGQRGW